jgi:hypothetical protein
MGKYQKMVMINAWENASIDTKEEIRLSYSKKAGPNWNTNDWARLIHRAWDKEHIIARINNVSTRLLLL